MPGVVLDRAEDRPYGPGNPDYEYDKWRDEMDEKLTPTNKWFVPVTPAGTPLIYSAGSRGFNKVNAARTREVAIKNLLADAAHMPYGSWEAMEKRGYTIEEWNLPKDWRP